MSSRDSQSIQDLIERSSLGTPYARRLRARTPSDVVDRILARSRELLALEAEEPAGTAQLAVPEEPTPERAAQLLDGLVVDSRSMHTSGHQVDPLDPCVLSARRGPLLIQSGEPGRERPTGRKGEATGGSTPPPFDDVLQAARGQAEWALARLYESLAPAVTIYLRAHGVREAEDVASDVFVAVLHGCSSFRGDETQFRRWVFTIAHSRMLDTRRFNARTHMGSLDAGGSGGMEPGASPAAEDDALRDLGNERVGRLLAALSSDQRCVLALRIIADLSVEDVAIALDKPPGAVKALQHRALATLRRTLSEEEVASDRAIAESEDEVD